MKKLRPYASYSDSGVPWIGKIPETWRTYPIRAVAVVRNGATPDSKNQDYWDGDIPWFTPSDLDFDVVTRLTCPKRYISAAGYRSCATNLSPPGSVIVSTRAPVGNIGITATESTTNQGCRTLTPKGGITPAFLASALMAARDELNLRSNGTTFVELSTDSIKSIKLPIPSQEEVEVISSFLDRETTRIDTLIAKKTRFIELLKEKRQAVITKAVTKGLDDSVEMKESGLAWLPKVPAHWEVRRMASLFREAVRPGDPSLPILSISIHDGITDEELAAEDRDRRVAQIEDRSKYKRVKPNDIAYNMMRAWQGAFGAVAVEGLVSPAYVVAEPIEALQTGYIEQLLRTPSAIEEMRRYSRGIADFRMRLYWDYFRDLKVCFPPVIEQKAILERIGRETARINLLVAKTERSIELLKEHRAALITAAVTGKIDVREAA